MAISDIVIKARKNLITKMQMLKYENFKNNALMKRYVSNTCKLKLR